MCWSQYHVLASLPDAWDNGAVAEGAAILSTVRSASLGDEHVAAGDKLLISVGLKAADA